MVVFSVGRLPNCPPSNAEQTEAVFFRACDSNPPTEEDFISHAESLLPRKRNRADSANCAHWGLSGWISHEEAKHAQAVFDWLKPKFIFSTKISTASGRLLQTGRPSHYTFWPCHDFNLLISAELALPPIDVEK